MNESIKELFFAKKCPVVSHTRFEKLMKNWHTEELFGSYKSYSHIIEKYQNKVTKRVNVTTSVRGYYTHYLLIKK